MTNQEKQEEALSRAANPMGSASNYVPIIRGFIAKGIPADQIEPRRNVFTFNAWKALGRIVRKGEHGVKILTYIPIDVKDKKAPDDPTKARTKSRPWTTTVFHISQTEPIKGQG